MTTNSDTNGTPDGTIRIIDTGGVHERLHDQLDGEITIDLQADEGPRIATALGSGNHPELVVEESQVSAGKHPPRRERDTLDGTFAWLALLPALTFLVAVVSAAVVGPQLWSVATSPLGDLVVRAGHLWLFGVSLAGTLWIETDARVRVEADAAWQPSVTPYVVGGGACLAVFGGGFYLLQGTPARTAVVATAGLFLLGLPTSSIVSGPVYLIARARQGLADNAGLRG